VELIVRRFFRAALIAVMLVSQTAAPLLAGTTGIINGRVIDVAGNKPLADARVTATSPSGIATTTTDGNGRFIFVSLAPDTYTVSVFKDGYEPVSEAGVSVFADETFTIEIHTHSTLKTIANVTSRNSGDLVKPGTTADVYSVNAQSQELLQSIGGGTNLNSAYSALLAVPGVLGYMNNRGWNQTIYIRGSRYDQVGFEYDGIPVNRAFDQYPATTLTTLGQQELQVYTGGEPSSEASQTVGGFINQVIKTGTYPGFGSIRAGLGYPIFYHNLRLEAGGATPNRMFSWYAGFGGYNQDFRSVNDCEECNIADDGSDQYGFIQNMYQGSLYPTTPSYNYGPYPDCNADGTDPSPIVTNSFGGQDPFSPVSTQQNPTNNYGPMSIGCFNYAHPNPSGPLQDREAVVNLHFGIPHRFGAGRDDLQLLYSDSSMLSYQAQSFLDQGGISRLNEVFSQYGSNIPLDQNRFDYINYWWYGYGLTGGAGNAPSAAGFPGEFGPNDSGCAGLYIFGNGCNGPDNLPQFTYQDTIANAPGTQFGQDATTLKEVPYLWPNSPAHAPGAPFSSSADDGAWNDAAAIKAQYTKNIGSNAYVRLMGYSLYSDWLLNGMHGAAIGPATAYNMGCSVCADYTVGTHTRGAMLQFADQISSSHLLTGTLNYTTANSMRFNNATIYNGTGDPVSNLADANGNCYSWEAFTDSSGVSHPAGSLDNCYDVFSYGRRETAGGPARGEGFDPCGSTAYNGNAGPAPGSPACVNGARWIVTVPGDSGTYNTVSPRFTTAALQDQWNPNDKLALNFGLRYENFGYTLADGNTPEANLWFKAAAEEFCYNPQTMQPYVPPLKPGQNPNSLQPFEGAVCPMQNGVQMVHPDGQNGHVLYWAGNGGNINEREISPRIGGTYTMDPNTVLRFSYGRYAQPSDTAFVQYLDKSARRAATFNFIYFFQFGFYTPTHNYPAQVSNNYDFSLERRLPHTDVSFKLTPFYRYTTNQFLNVTIGGGLTSALPVGTQKTTGIEFQISKGDPNKNGWSGLLSYTYTHAREKFSNFANGKNALDNVNNYISTFNALTKAGGGSPCYDPTTIDPNTGEHAGDSCSKTTDIANPYYNMSPQALYDRNAWIDVYGGNLPGGPPDYTQTALWPHNIAGYVSYHRGRLRVTPNFVIQAGIKYGDPLSLIGVDPRQCGQNQGPTDPATLLGAGVEPAGSPYAQNCDYLTARSSVDAPNGNLAIPDPYTGKFDSFG
jgi:hypothetical protein